jgi:hypothetical protein
MQSIIPTVIPFVKPLIARIRGGENLKEGSRGEFRGPRETRKFSQ